MNPIRPLSHSIQPLLVGEGEAASNLPAMHAAVLSGDSARVTQLRNEGVRINELDNEKRSPLDVLDTMRDIDEQSRSGMRMALLQSLSPTAPIGYMKPEALHGTPWGLEILQSGSLKGGVNDPKGGRESLERMVFFSDRTPESDKDETTRLNLRVKPRLYANGKGVNVSNASSRAQQHRLSQVITHAASNGKPLPTLPGTVTIEVSDLKQAAREGGAWLQRFLHDKYILKGAGQAFTKAPLGQGSSALKLPASITLRQGDSTKVLVDSELQDFFHQAAHTLQSELESGKAPYLSLLNRGTVVPLVFGFEKVKGLSAHEISTSIPGKNNRFMYKANEHRLAGGPDGGKIKEVEVRTLGDLVTLHLGCELKNIKLPEDLLVRLKTSKKEKAEYLDASAIARFRTNLLERVSEMSSGAPLNTLSLETLQEINAELRASDPRTFLRES
ncbi:Uncharacterized protein ABJ99_3262 [Pseudomonas syringae pv. cilantro]|nr:MULTISPECIES: hypothetical protein [Pseudomonas syringae group]KPC25864.1 Uncharacterized protein ABJ99_3262 [Pseudomonas syringae pv. cilantro]